MIRDYVENNDGGANDEEGCEEGFLPDFEVSDRILTGFFLDEVFVFLNNKNKINYVIDDKVFSITTLNSNYYLLGYMQSINKIMLMNKQFQLISYTFPLSFVNYQMAILKGNFDQAEKVLIEIILFLDFSIYSYRIFRACDEFFRKIRLL